MGGPLHWGIEAVRGWCYTMPSLRPSFYLKYLDVDKMGGSVGKTQKPRRGLYTASPLHWPSYAGRGCWCRGWPQANAFQLGCIHPFFKTYPTRTAGGSIYIVYYLMRHWASEAGGGTRVKAGLRQIPFSWDVSTISRIYPYTQIPAEGSI